MAKRLVGALLAAMALLLVPPAAQADFGLLPGAEGFDVAVTAEGGGAPDLRAGGHPYSMVTTVNFNTDGDAREIHLELPPGLIENPSAVLKCSQAEFHTARVSPFEESRSGESCPPLSQIGVVEIRSSAEGGSTRTFGVFNLDPPAGAPSQFGFSPYETPVTFTPHLRDLDGGYGLTLDLHDLSQALELRGFTLTIWGNPWGTAHHAQRGECLNEVEPSFGHAKCPLPLNPPHLPYAYLTLPASCGMPIAFRISANSWQAPDFVNAVAVSRNAAGLPAGLEGCGLLAFKPEVGAQPTNLRASSPSGLDFSLSPREDALTDPTLKVPAQPRKAVVSLPDGMTINPALAAGLGSCSPAAFAAETVSSPPGAGCPNVSKIGQFTVRSPLFATTIGGAIFLAKPDDRSTGAPGAENPFDSLLALYLVAKAPGRGILVKVAGRLVANPASGQLTAFFDDLPQLPYSDLELHFRSGQRAPLVTPSACGAFSTQVELTPWNNPTVRASSAPAFRIDKGIGPGGSCPPGATPPFNPQALGGSLNSNSGSYTPFYLRLTRTDAEQEITSYSATLPKGLTGRLAGVGVCPDAAIEAAKLRGGVEETVRPSCPASSEIGRTVAGYGVGQVLAYAPGKMYLAGPYRGSPLSVVAIDAATVGPFDLGTIVIRSAFEVDPRTGQLSLDSAVSDPIPHIVEGIPLHLRDIRVYIDRHRFTLNPTSCEPATVTSVLTGSGIRFSDPSDDTLASSSNHYQVSNCSARDFAPKVGLRLKGATRRGGYPALRAVVQGRRGDANVKRVAVALPHTAFLAQSHIRDVCTRRQFAERACPASSIYGRAVAQTPLLGGQLRGPVYLRSSDNPLPDLVADLREGPIRIIVEGRIDSVGNGRIRGIFDSLPDAPLTKFVLTMRGGRRGLIVNSADLCEEASFATVRMVGQNNTGMARRAKLRADCPRDWHAGGGR